MKTLLFFILFINPTFAQIVFLDINNNRLEKQSALEAATKAGKTIIIYPEDEALFSKEKAFEILKTTHPETLILSGHNGGGSFGGDRNESFSRYDLMGLMDSNPEIAQNLKVLGLLGCNTANHRQILDWKATFPRLSFIAGYDGTAPLGIRLSGRNYLKDMILKTDEILKETDEKKIKNIFSNFSNIADLSATLFINFCGQEFPEDLNHQYIYRPQRKADEKFKLFDGSECENKRKEYVEKYKSIYFDYYLGIKDIPVDISQSPIRELYTFINQNEHCFEELDDSDGQSFPRSEKVRNLLFYNDVFNNFVTYYQEDMELFFEIIDTYRSEESIKNNLKKIKNRYQDALSKMEHYFVDYNQYETDYKIRIEALKNSKGEKIDVYIQNLKMGKNGYPYNNLQESINLIKEQIVTLNRYINSTEAPKEEDIKWTDLFFSPPVLKNAYDSLPAKNLDEFKKLNHKQVLDFIHGINQLNLFSIPHDKHAYQMRENIGNILEYINPEIIPFNWHDDQLGMPLDPHDKDSKKSNMNKLREEESNILDQIFKY